MRSEILRQLQSEYEEQRAADTRTENARMREVTEHCPEIGRLQEERQNVLSQGMMRILNGTGTADDLPKRMEVLNGRIRQVLKENGYAEDWLEPVYRCPKCRDTGYVGEPVREMCECMRSAYFRRLYEAIGLRDAEEETFENFRTDIFPDTVLPSLGYSQRKDMLLNKRRCEQFCTEASDGKAHYLVLSGPSGLGKTYLLRAMAHRLLDSKRNVLLLSAYRLFELARKAYFSGDTDPMEDLLTADVLMVDDLGSEPLVDNVTVVQLFNLINERQNAGRSTAFSTNLTVEELRRRYTERVASRILDGRNSVLIQLQGQDVRHPQGGEA